MGLAVNRKDTQGLVLMDELNKKSGENGNGGES